jgi:hypothetical protein
MAIRVSRVSSPSGVKNKGRRSINRKKVKKGKKNAGVVSESYFLGDASTLPLLSLDGNIQQNDFNGPGLSMGSISILEENDPTVIKDYLCGLVDMPANLLNAGSAQNLDKSVCIDMEGNTPNLDFKNSEGRSTWSVREVSVSPVQKLPSFEDQEKVTESMGKEPDAPKTAPAPVPAPETAAAPKTIKKPHSSMDGMIEEFSQELEKKFKENGFGSGYSMGGEKDIDTVLQSVNEEPDVKSEEIAPTPALDSGDEFSVEDVLLIYNNGTLVCHARRDSSVDIDDDIFSAMLTAVKEFIKDSFGRKDKGGLKRMDFDMKKILIEYGNNVYLTSVLQGGEPVYLPLYMMEVLKEVEEKYGPVFNKWDGKFTKLDGIDEMVSKLLGITDEPASEIEGFESGAVAQTIRLIEKAKKNGMPESNPEIFAKNITRAIEKQGFGNAWNYLKRTEQELTDHLGVEEFKDDKEEVAEEEEQPYEPEIEEKPEIEEPEIDEELAEMEDTVKGLVGLMDELDTEKRGTQEERDKLRDMINDIEERMGGFGGGAEGTEDDRNELRNITKLVTDKMNELKMEKMDSEMGQAEMEGTLKGIEDKMTDLEISQIGTEAERAELKRMMDGIEEKITQIESGGMGSDTAKEELEGLIQGIEEKMAELDDSRVDTEVERAQLKRMMDGIEDKIAEIEGSNIETETAKAEIEGYLKGFEEKMTELEISQIGTEAERTELTRLMDELQGKISELDEEKKKENEEVKKRMEDMVKGMEEKMAKLESKLKEAEEKVEELEGEVEVKKFTREYIQNIESRDELETLCKEAGLSCEGSNADLKYRLLNYLEGSEGKPIGKGEKEDNRFTEKYIREVSTKSELAELCDEAGLKKTGKKEELRERLLEYVKKKELTDKPDSTVSGHKIKAEGMDKLVYAVLGDMLKHLSMDVDENVQEYVNELEDFIRAVLEVREELGLGNDDILKNVVIKPSDENLGRVLTKLKTPFLNKTNADDLEVVKPEEEWEGIKLQMDINWEMIEASYKSQATKIQMLVEGYPVTIAPEMLEFSIVIPENYIIKESEHGIVYISTEIIKAEKEDELPPPPPPELVGEVSSPEPEQSQTAPEPPRPTQYGEPKQVENQWEESPPPPSDFRLAEKPKKKKGKLIVKLKKRWGK